MKKLLIMCIAALFGCQAAENGAQESMPPIPALSEQTAMAETAWNTAFSAGDAETIGSFYAADAVVYPPGEDAVVGREAITEFWAGALAFSTNGSIKSAEADNDGTIGYEVGTYAIQDSTGMEVDHGKYVVVWKYVNGEWKLFRDTWNSSVGSSGEMDGSEM